MRFDLLTRDVRSIGTYYLRVSDEHPGYALLKSLASGRWIVGGKLYEPDKPVIYLIIP